MPGEDHLICKLRRLLPGGKLLGDDTVTLALSPRSVLTVDQQVEGVHFRSAIDPGTVAARLLEVTLSDLAASGAIPRAGLLALSAPPTYNLQKFFRGLSQALAKRAVSLVGGDLSRGDSFRAALCFIGHRPPQWGTLARSLARPGDRIWLAGTVGESALGRFLLEQGAQWNGRSSIIPAELKVPSELVSVARRAVRRHLRPEALLKIGWNLARSRKRIAAQDVSDGLALDLSRLATASRAGAVLEVEALCKILPASAASLARHLDLDPIELVLSGGEDYALLFTTPARTLPPVSSAQAIGRIVAEPGLWLESPGGEPELLTPSGWDHLVTSQPLGGARRP